MEYIFYYELSSKKEARTYNYTKKTFATMLMKDVYKLKKRYYLPMGYEPSETGLKLFAKHFFVAVEKLKDNDIFTFDYTKYKSHESASVEMFKKLCNGKYEDMEKINSVEYEWIESCNNSSQRYCKPGKYNCYGYDYSSQYPAILASEQFEIPTCAGTEKTITEIDYTKLEVGFYKVRITSKDTRFQKVFSFSREHVYTHTSLFFAYQCKTKQGYEIEMELIKKKKEHNCYIYGKYKKDNIVKGSVIFGKWYGYFSDLKERYPECKVLIKILTSTLWGRLAEFHRIFKTMDQIITEDLNVSLEYNTNSDYYIRNTKKNKKGEDLLELVSSKNPYYFSIARIKPFLLSKSREMIGKVANKYIDSVVRIHTDCVCFNERRDDVIFQLKTFKLTKENKTTGLIDFKRVDCYKNYTTGYETKNYKKTENNEYDDSDDETDD